MEKYIHRQNLKHFRDLLDTVTDVEQRKQIARLLAEEEAKDALPKIGPPAE